MKKQDYISFITNKYFEKDVHIVASGPSLVGFDYSYFNNKNVIATNHSFKLTRHDFCVFVDKRFLKEDSKAIGKTFFLARQGIPDANVNFPFAEYFSFNPADGVYPRNRKQSGAAALTIALQGGARRVFLWGFDCRFLSADEAQRAAYLNGNPAFTPDRSIYGHSSSGKFDHKHDSKADESIFKTMIDLFDPYPEEKIINMSKFSAIKRFRIGA